MYVAVKGGEKAIDAAHALQESRRRGDTDLPAARLPHHVGEAGGKRAARHHRDASRTPYLRRL